MCDDEKLFDLGKRLDMRINDSNKRIAELENRLTGQYEMIKAIRKRLEQEFGDWKLSGEKESLANDRQRPTCLENSSAYRDDSKPERQGGLVKYGDKVRWIPKDAEQEPDIKELCKHYKNNQCKVDMSDCMYEGKNNAPCYDAEQEPDLRPIPIKTESKLINGFNKGYLEGINKAHEIISQKNFMIKHLKESIQTLIGEFLDDLNSYERRNIIRKKWEARKNDI